MSYASVFKAGLFNGTGIIVTGGGSGIGRCTAHELASLGAHVFLVGRKPEKLERVANEITSDGGKASYHSCDIRVEDAVIETVRVAANTLGRIDGLVNNAGGQFPAPLSAISQKGFETVVRTNLVGSFLMAREVYSQWMSTNGGSIVGVVTDMWKGMPGMGHSGAAREGVVNLTKTAAVEWAAAGVRVNAVAPGWIASSGLDTYDEAIARDLIPKLKDGVPLQRLGTEEEISAMIVFLLSPAAAFITGATIPIDGGAPLASFIWPMEKNTQNVPYTGFHRRIVPKALAEKKE